MFDRLFRRIATVERRINDTERRIRNMFREGKVDTVNEDGTVIVQMDGELKSKPVPWLTRAGDINDWSPPSKGERVLLISPSGELGQGLCLVGGYSEDFAQPHDKLGEHKRVVGETSDTTTENSRTIVAENILLTGNVTIEGDLKSSGGVFEHEGKNVGHDHKHKDVKSGPDKTGEPE